MFDTKHEGRLDKAAYQGYLRGIGAWGRNGYTDADWDERRQEDCELLGCTAATGITKHGFKRMYIIEYRAIKLAADLAACRSNMQ